MNRLTIIIILSLSIVPLLFITKSCNQSGKIDGLESVIKEKNGELERTENKLGQEKVSRLVAEADREIIKKSYEAEIKEVREKLGVKIRNLEGIVKAQTVNSGSATVRVDTVYVLNQVRDSVHDSVQQLVYYDFEYADNWLNLSGRLYNHSVDLTWDVVDHLTFAFERKPTGLFKPKELIIHATSDNPNTHYTNLMSVKVGVEKRKPFGIGPYIGVGPGGLQVGIGIQYSFIRF